MEVVEYRRVETYVLSSGQAFLRAIHDMIDAGTEKFPTLVEIGSLWRQFREVNVWSNYQSF